MATITAIAFNLFETIGLVQPRIEIIGREPEEHDFESKPLCMQWVHEADSTGRKVIRIRWVEDKQRGGATPAARRNR
jgi:hypothetical protein